MWHVFPFTRGEISRTLAQGRGRRGWAAQQFFPGCRPAPPDHGEGPLGKAWQSVGSKPVLFLLQQAFSPFLHDMKELLYLDVLYKAVYHF